MEEAPYLDLLRETELAAAGTPPAGSEAEAAAIDRFLDFFSSLDPESVKRKVDGVYAKEAVLYDTLVLHRGLESIRPYFMRTAERAAGVRVEVLDVIRSGPEFYLKWQMDIDWSAFKKGKTTRSFGISHLRFNHEGRVILHYDFWDSTQGFFEHLPLLGGLIRWIKQRVARTR